MPDRANHAVRDGDLRIVYIAADGGLYKLFPDSKEIFLMKAVEGDEIGYMVGYGALTRRVLPIPVNIEMILTPARPTGYGFTDPKYVFRHYKPATGWRLVPPPVPNIAWQGVRANKFLPDKWIVWGTEDTLMANVQLYLTLDAGVTWQHVLLPPAGGSTRIELQNAFWSTANSETLYVAASPNKGAVNNSAAVYYGNPETAMQVEHIVTAFARHGRWQTSVGLDNGDFYGRTYQGGGLSAHPKRRVVMQPNGTLIINALTEIEIVDNSPTAQAGSALVVFDNGAPSQTFRTLNYLASEITDLSLSLNIAQAAWTVDGRIFMGSGENTGVRELLTPTGSPSVAVVAGAGQTIQAIAADLQTRTAVVAMSITGSHYENALFYVFNGTTWEEFGATDDIDSTWVNRGTLEVIVRS